MILGGRQLQPRLGEISADSWFPSRSEIAAETSRLDSNIKAMGGDFFEDDSDADGVAFLARWNAFVTEWVDWKDSWYFSASSRRDELLAFEARFNDFLRQFQSKGGASSLVPLNPAPATPGPLDSLAAAAEQTAANIRNAIIIAGLLAGGLVVYTVWEAGRTVRAVGPRILR